MAAVLEMRKAVLKASRFLHSKFTEVFCPGLGAG